MSAEEIGLEYYVYLLAWLLAPIALFTYHSRGCRLAGVLLYAYIVGFFIIHWVGALVHASPSSQFADSTDTIVGFRVSTYALFALLAGALLIPAPRRLSPTAPQGAKRLGRRALNSALPSNVARTLLLSGAFFWLLIYTPVASIPSATAVLSAGKQCLVLGICLMCWTAWQQGDLWRFRLWLATAFILPVVTLLTEGFISYGIGMLGTVLVFIAMFYRPRWLLLVGLLGGIYAGMSVWISYASQRDDMRQVVWGGQSLELRIDAWMEMITSIEPFDFSNLTHLDLVAARLNQNWLVGAAVRTTPERVPYAAGETITAAILAIIPRAIWPDKPALGGSGHYAARHTMTDFAEGTSVGMGQVLELYINFGVLSVLIGFFLLGAMLRKLDLSLVRALEAGDFRRVQFFFLVGAGALQAGGSLTELVASMAGGAVLSIAISRYLAYRFGKQSLERTAGRARVNSAPARW